VWGDVIGCLLLLPISGFLVLMGIYMTTLMGYFAALAGAMGIYAGGLIAYFTAFIMWILL
jgi:hypothetical protein